MDDVRKMQPIEGVHGLPEHSHVASSVFSVNRKKFMMWIFIISDALLFAGFLAAYGFERFISPGTWPDRWKIFEPGYIAAMTVLLLSSSTFMATAVECLKQKNRRLFSIFYLMTILSGFSFLGMQAHEWSHFIGQGATLSANPWGVPLFSALFFVITGFHGLHVFSGVLTLCIVGILWSLSKTSVDTVELAGMYWSFIDLVWVFIFTILYLI